MTWWKNPRAEAVTLRIFEAPGQWLVVHIPAGEAREVPSAYDRGLQEVKDGRVVGGMATYLVRIDGPPANSTPASPAPRTEPEPEPALIEAPPREPPRTRRKGG